MEEMDVPQSLEDAWLSTIDRLEEALELYPTALRASISALLKGMFFTGARVALILLKAERGEELERDLAEFRRDLRRE
jgi:hypothetical protein